VSTLRQYFEREAQDCLLRMAALEPAFATGDARSELYRVARELRGVAQLAREGAVQQAAHGIEQALRPGGAIARAPLAGALLGVTVAELAALVRGVGDDGEAANRAAALAGHWAGLATEPRAEPIERDGAGGPDAAADHALGAPVVDGADGAVIDVATLCYDRETALGRAVELRGRVERAIGEDDDAREAVEELFDLLRIARG
jgi:hypothetical protein